MKEKPTENLENTSKCQRAKTVASGDRMTPACSVLVFHLAPTYGTTGDTALTLEDFWMEQLKPFLRHFRINFPGHTHFLVAKT